MRFCHDDSNIDDDDVSDNYDESDMLLAGHCGAGIFFLPLFSDWL
jgi:hypothetical protein